MTLITEFDSGLLFFFFGFIVGMVILYLVKRNRWHEFITVIYPPSIYCWLIETGQDNKIQIHEKHHAIIIAATKLRTKFHVYFSGVSTLLVSLKLSDQKTKYKIYCCSEMDAIKKVIEDPYTTHVWIFGHGIKHGVEVGKEVLFYCELKDIPQKEFIGQYHCNHGGGKSFADYNHPKIQDITNSFRSNIEIENGVKTSLIALKIIPRELTARIFIDAMWKRCRAFIN